VTRVNDRREARSRRRAIKRLAAASDDELRDEYARFWRMDYHLEAALQALRAAAEHARQVPYQGQNQARLHRVARRLEKEQSAGNADSLCLESEMYRRWGRSTGQDFDEWIRPFRDEVRGEAREAVRREVGEDSEARPKASGYKAPVLQASVYEPG
jgi:hypothetical protein